MRLRVKPLYAERMRRLMPDPCPELTDEELLEDAFSPTPGESFVRFNMVSSVDGRAALDGVSNGLGAPADHRLFSLLRGVADAIVVGSGTALAEGYAGELLPEWLREWRVARGLPSRPTTVILSNSGSLPPDSPVLSDAPAPTCVVIGEDAAPERIQSLRSVCEVILVPAGAPAASITAALATRGLLHLHHEGGPGVLSRYVVADAVDSLCLSVTPLIAPAGTGAITAPAPARSGAARPLVLHRLYEQESTLLTEYRRGPSA